MYLFIFVLDSNNHSSVTGTDRCSSGRDDADEYDVIVDTFRFGFVL